MRVLRSKKLLVPVVLCFLCFLGLLHNRVVYQREITLTAKSLLGTFWIKTQQQQQQQQQPEKINKGTLEQRRQRFVAQYFANKKSVGDSRSTGRAGDSADNGGHRKPLLLMWTKMWEQNWTDVSAVTEWNCGTKTCLVTRNREYLNNSDLVMFTVEFSNEKDLPPRHNGQPWLLNAGEPPTVMTLPSYLDGRINLTSTYHREADIAGVYGYTESLDPKHPISYPQHFHTLSQIYRPPGLTGLSQDVIRGMKNKSMEALFFVSNCKASHRLRLVEKLKQGGLQIDILGNCGKPDPCKHEKLCSNKFRSQYHFYLAFENSHCQDYITEKVWKSLELGVVPIVMGPSIEDYNIQLPPDSFLHVDNFTSPLELAKFAKHLIEHPDEYMRYHEWRRHYKAVDEPTKLCTICQNFQAALKLKKKPRDVSKWWQTSKLCRSPKFL